MDEYNRTLSAIKGRLPSLVKDMWRLLNLATDMYPDHPKSTRERARWDEIKDEYPSDYPE